MATCPKCMKPNPGDAAFCGFCGAKVALPEAPAAKTVFGYQYDPEKEKGKAPPQQAAAPAPAPAPAPAAAAAAAAVPPTDATVPYPAGQGVVAGRYWLGTDSSRLPVGDLFRGKDVNDDVELDILLVDKEVFHSPLDMERARRELRQLQKVDCPAIVKVIDHGKADDERLYVVMERVEGTPLDQVVAERPRSLAEAQAIVKGVGQGLAEAQKMGVIHRDIAPHNVLVVGGGSVKVRGFGVAGPIKRHVFGTPEFISPEQASGRPVDQRSNIYSLGALMFYMLVGKPVFTADSTDELLAKHQKEEAPSPKAIKGDLDLPARAEALILKALAKSSSRRHLTLRQFLREVESLATSAPAQAGPAEASPLSFETPLHGVTALKGGQAPPPSTGPQAKVERQQVVEPPGGAVLPAPSDAPTVQGGISVGQVQAAAAASPAPPPSAVETMVDPVTPDPVTPETRRSQVTGEVSSAASLKQPDPEPLTNQKKATAPPAAGPPAGGGKGGFRETMWFFKGEVESAMAADGSEEVIAKPEGEPSAEELATKYKDDGSMSEEEARRLSLRTGNTQMMQKVNIPSGQLPGEKMAAEDFIGEMHRGRRIMIWVGVFVVLAAIGGVVTWLLLS